MKLESASAKTDCLISTLLINCRVFLIRKLIFSKGIGTKGEPGINGMPGRPGLGGRSGANNYIKFCFLLDLVK